MNIYMLLRLLVSAAQLTPAIPPNEAELIRQAARDLIDKLEKTQALGSLTSDLKGHLHVILPNVR